MDLTVSEAMAQYFYDQCAGQYNGYMAALLNNPVIYGLVMAHSADRKEDFVRFLRQVADKLEVKPEF